MENRRSEDLATSVAAISSARLLAGELSGPMHLAQLCGVPILIWADGQWHLDNCERWNVFRVPIYIVANDTHRPVPETRRPKIVSAWPTCGSARRASASPVIPSRNNFAGASTLGQLPPRGNQGNASLEPHFGKAPAFAAGRRAMC